MIGTQVQHFRIRQKLGEGGMGEVFLAEDTRLERQVALKFLPPYLTKDPEFRSRFEHEAKAAAALNHPNIVTVYELNEHEGRQYIAMELVDGESLEKLIERGDVPVARAVEIVQQICEGLHEAHEAGIVHRDIKPSNILIDSKGRARILDFGLAKSRKAKTQTATGTTLGTLQYESPEQVSGQQVDARSDLFSLGAVLYELITGRTPFAGEFEEAIRYSIVHDDPEPLARYKSGELGELQRIVGRALAKDPSLRYQSAADILAELKTLHAPQVAPAPTPRPRWPWMVAAAAVVVLAGFLVVERYFDRAGGPKADWADSVAVLVFRDLSPEKDQDYFCEGMTEAIITRLQYIGQLKTISIQSILRFKGSTSGPAAIAKELSVDNVLVGSVQSDGDNIRVRAELIRANDEESLWSERFESKLSGVFSVQDEISRSIADALKLHLTGDQSSALTRQGTQDIEAYNEYLQGRYFWRKRIENDLYTALEHFQRAVELDPDYAEAWAGIADVWSVLHQCSNLSEMEVTPKAREAAEKALSLDSRLCEAHASMGLVYRNELEIDKSEQAYLRAIELNPNYPWAHVWYAGLLSDFRGDYGLSIDHLEKALDLDPLSTVALRNLAMWHRENREYERSGQLLRKALEIEPNNVNWLGQYAFHWTWVGQQDSALRYAKQTVALEPNNWRSRYFYGTILGGQFNRYDEAREQFLLASQLSPNNYLPLQFLGNFYWQRRAYDTAVSYLERAVGIYDKAHYSFNVLAYCYARLDQYESAIEAVSRAIEIAPFQSSYIDTRADIHAQFGKYEDAIEDYRLFLSKVPGSFPAGETIRELALALDSSGRKEEADLAFMDAINSRPHDADLCYSYAKYLHEERKEHQGAVRQYQAAIGIDSGDGRYYNDLADCYWELDKEDSALWAVSVALELEPNSFDSWDTKADLCSRLGLLDSALSAYRRCLELRPQRTSSMIGMGRAALLAGRYELADSLFEVDANQDKAAHSRAWGRMRQAQALTACGRFREAVGRFHESATVDSTEMPELNDDRRNQLFSWYWNLLDIYKYYIDDYEAALKIATAFRSLVVSLTDGEFPKRWLPTTAGCMAYIHARGGNFAAAERWLDTLVNESDSTVRNAQSRIRFYRMAVALERRDFEVAAELAKNSGYAHMKGLAYLGAGQIEEAIKQFERAIENRFTYRTSGWEAAVSWWHYGLGLAYEADGQIRKAADQYEIFLDRWKDADPDLESVVDARARLSRLKNEAG